MFIERKLQLKTLKQKLEKKNTFNCLIFFVVIGYNYKKIITCEDYNEVGKMNTEVYTTWILRTLVADPQFHGLTLCQDTDSAHTSTSTINWAKNNNLPLVTLPGKSPDFQFLRL